jgi:2-haloalkanoic acid dehalogenase type II
MGARLVRLTDFSTLTFDCYGTLIDWETGINGALGPWLRSVGIHSSRDQLLEAFARAESAQQEATPAMRYPDLLAEVHKVIARHFGVASNLDAAAVFGTSVKDWPALPDSAEALGYLKQHYQLVILSNVDRGSFTHSNQKLGVAFDAIFTAEDIGSYKPNPRNFEHLLRELGERGIAKEKILHTAESLHHDHVPAKRFGLATCWIHRRAGKQGHGATRVPEQEVQPDFRFESLAAMAEAHRAELLAGS